MGKILQIGICKNKGDEIVSVSEVEAIQGEGLINDRKYKENNEKMKQITLIEIENINSVELNEHNHLYHAGTTQKDEKIYAIGGRVLNFVSLSDNFSDAKIKIVQNLDKLNWSGGFYRKDIGYKVIE